MAELNKEPVNPQTPSLDRIETLSRNFVVNNRRTLQPVERVLRIDPQTSRELDNAGGFGNLLTRGQDQRLERDYFSRFTNIQTSLFVDRVTQGDILKTPALETMHETSRENTKILTAIATELDSCCEEIKKKNR